MHIIKKCSFFKYFQKNDKKLISPEISHKCHTGGPEGQTEVPEVTEEVSRPCHQQPSQYEGLGHRNTERSPLGRTHKL